MRSKAGLTSDTTPPTRFALRPSVGTVTAPEIDTLSSSCCRITLGLGPEIWRVLAKCHEVRNKGEYEGDLNINERLVTDLIAACRTVARRT